MSELENFNMADKTVYDLAAAQWVKGIKQPTYLSFGNHASIDLHLEVTCDVKGGTWGPYKFFHGATDEAESEKVKFGNKANYCVKVMKNDNGNPGTELDTFEHSVRYNLAGNRDHLEFAVVTVDGENYLQVISIREAAIIAMILLLG